MQKLSSPNDLIKKAVTLFFKKENLIFLVKIYIPAGMVALLVVGQSYLPSSITDSNSIWWLSTVVLLQILSGLVSIFVAISGIIALGKVVSGGELSVKKTYELAWKQYWKFALFSIVSGLIYVFGFTLLIIPAVIFGVWFIFSRFLFIEKKMGIKESLLKSKEMVKGIFWKVLGRCVVFGVFAIIVQMLLGIIPFGIGSVLVSLVGAVYILPIYLLYLEVKG